MAHAKACLDSMPDVLDASDVAYILDIGYVKALRTIKHGGMNYIQIGRVYKISKHNFLEWLNCSKPRVIDLD